MLNASDYVDFIRDYQETSGLGLTDKLNSPDVLIDRTDWQEEIFRNGTVTDHTLTVSGGTDDVNYAFQQDIKYQEGTVINRDFERLNLGLKLNEKLFNDHVRLGQNIRFKQDNHRGVQAQFIDALRMPPYMEIYDETNLGGYSRTDKVTDLQDARNPLNSVYNSIFESLNNSVNIELFGEVDIVEGLIFKTQARISTSNGHSMNWNYASETGNGPVDTAMNETYFNWSSFFWEKFLDLFKHLW